MNIKRKSKEPQFGANPGKLKTPRSVELPNDELRPEFKVCKMDMDGKWGWSTFDPRHLKEFLSRLLDCQKLTWQELRQNGSHCVQTSQIVSDARKRLQVLQLDDWEELYSLRLAGKPRIWGLKEVGIFWILWWDPNHEICPSQKKHT
jgi:hypothetical protein